MNLQARLLTLYSLVLIATLQFSSTAYSHGLVHEQIKEVTKEIKSNPEDTKLYIQRGRLYVEDKHYRNAELDYKKALSIDENTVEAIYYLGDLSLKRGNYKKSIEYADTFLEKLSVESSFRMRGFYLKGLAHKGAKEYEPAISALAQTIKEASFPLPEYYLELSSCYISINQHHQAIEVLKQGLEKRGDLPVFQDEMVKIYLSQNQYKEALSTLDTMINKGQRVAFLHTQKAKVLKQQGNTSEAKTSFNLALESIANLPESRRSTPALLELQEAIKTEMKEFN